MNDTSVITQFYKELEAEIPATRKCIERVSENLYTWKPHEKSMTMGYLTSLVTEIPRWIAVMIKSGEIDFQTFQHTQANTTQEMVTLFDTYTNEAKQALKELTVDQLSKPFVLRSGNQIMINSPLIENLSSTLNHWVHHRGQLTVYMRLNNIDVPSIYGPSADEKTF
ncbi:damage-inducible protein DinB [Rhodocytophaga rosea]|uniref:Damage-inducible protein DinB n=1 Tax=Rhodocytophaga rosea TaxID=2704465 RepID=A0A6C0GFN6_9BACT|nr:DinB family protein [Rhodocytophaga rosea]QHT66719.1 damage-inducible protein DinB [Rhodocytophaga rosea]